MSLPARPARFAGRLYPAEPGALAAACRRLAAEAAGAAGAAPGPPPRLALVPHGGLADSGPVVAAALARLPAAAPEIVLVGPEHDPAEGPAVLKADDRPAWQTPCGEVALAGAPRVLGLPLAVDREAHDREHALEGVVAWLAALGRAPRVLPLLLPPMLGPPALDALLDGLAAWLREDPARLFLASADLDHYHGQPAGTRLRQATLAWLTAGEPAALLEAVAAGRAATCGPVALAALSGLAVRLGRTVRVVATGAGGPGAAVGYAAAVA